MDSGKKRYTINKCGLCKKRKRMYTALIDQTYKNKRVCKDCYRAVKGVAEVWDHISYYSFGGF